MATRGWIDEVANAGPNPRMFASPFSDAGGFMPSMTPTFTQFVWSHGNCDKCNQFSTCMKSTKNKVCCECLLDICFPPPQQEKPPKMCMVCLTSIKNEKNVLCWEKDGNEIIMCLNCVFEFILLKKAKSDFKSMIESSEKNVSNETNQ
jgi:hypothetical protein